MQKQEIKEDYHVGTDALTDNGIYSSGMAFGLASHQIDPKKSRKKTEGGYPVLKESIMKHLDDSS